MIRKMNNSNNMNIFDALHLLEQERGISISDLRDGLINAIAVSIKKNYNVDDDHVLVDLDVENRRFTVSTFKDVVEEVEDPNIQISLEDALAKNKRMKIGSRLETRLDTKKIGRIAAQAGKNLIHQAIAESVNNHIRANAGEVVSGVVQKIESRTGNVTVEIDKNEFVLFKNEQIPGEKLSEGDHIKVYVSERVVDKETGRTVIKISRVSREMVKRLFEKEVPEIYNGEVEIKAISREPGNRTKIAVWSRDENIDPRGACIGPKGTRVASVVKELNNEKIDIVLYSDDPEKFIASALSPATVLSVQILDPEERTCRVIVPDNQLSLAIGNKGQNAKLAARLTGYSIDIKPQSSLLQSSGSDDEQYANRLVIDLGDEEPEEEQAQVPAEEAEDAVESNPEQA